MRKFAALFKANRKMMFKCMVLSLMISCMSVGALASTDVQTVMTTSFQTMVDDIMDTAKAVVPICMLVLGLSVTVRFAVKWFKKLTGMA